MTIRTATSDDLPFLEAMQFEAFFWSLSTPRPPAGEFLARPEIQKFLAGWGRPGDRAVIAQEGTASIGAAWYRLWTDEDHSYGFVDAETPELGIGVEASHRSRGVGRALLRALIEAARDDGVRTLSLSVDPSNFARRLYESEGFVKVGASGTSWTYLLRITRRPGSGS